MPMIPLKRFRPRSRVGRAGMIAGGIVVALIALDLIAIAATAVIAATAATR